MDIYIDICIKLRTGRVVGYAEKKSLDVLDRNNNHADMNKLDMKLDAQN